jgi:hypothetical protein
LTFAGGLLLAGFLTDTFEGINKIAATPTWCLWSAALTCLVWIVLHLQVPRAEARRLLQEGVRSMGTRIRTHVSAIPLRSEFALLS